MRGSAVFRTSVTPGGALAGPWVRNPLWTAARAVPSLDLRFADNKSLVDATTGQNLVTFTRASSGTYVDSQGVIRTATTNLLLRSEEFDNASWAPTNATVTANQTIAPNGTLTADQFVENSAGTARLGQNVVVTPGVFYTASIYLKAGTNSIINWREDAEDVHGIQINLATGSITNGTGTIVPVGNDWYRVSFTGSVSGTTFKPEIRAANSPGTIFIWGAQLEQSSTVGEYIPTTSTINSAPRFDHNPTTGESLGLLVEEQRTNLAFPSNMPTSTIQTTTGNMQANGATQITSGVLAPDNSTTGFTVSGASVTTNTSGSNNVRILNVMAAAGTHTVSMWIKTNSSSTTVTVRDATSATAVNFTTTPSWTRVSATFNNTSAGNIILLSASGTAFDCFGVQVESGSFPTSYIPTTTATATRSADVASITGSNFSSWYRQDEGTVFVEAISPATSTTVFAISDGSTNNRIQIETGSNTRRFRVTSSGTSRYDNSVSYTLGTSGKSVGAYIVSGSNHATNGVLGVDLAGSPLPVVDRLLIGTNGAGLFYNNGTLKRLTYWPQRLPNNTLQQITQ